MKHDLKIIRELAGLTQFVLAQRSGLSRMRLSLIECREAEATDAERKALCEVLLPALRQRRVRSEQFEQTLENLATALA